MKPIVYSKSGLALLLLLAILITRSSHFGNVALLPDATLAVLFLGGILLRRSGWLAAMIMCAFAVDIYAIGFNGVSDYCMSPAYLGLIPTYAMVWFSGAWLARRTDAFVLLPFIFSGFVATSLAFVLSNAFWYQFSGRFAEMPLVEFASRIAQFYTPYVGFAVMYLGVAWAVRQAWLYMAGQQQARSV
jgi:hypothetical protein